jgi:hypothetical protein
MQQSNPVVIQTGLRSTSGTQPGPAVGVLIVVHNRMADLLRLLSSLFLSDYQAFDVLVIDDNSSEDISDVGRNFPLEYIRLEKNVGFVAGMTKGLRHLLRKERYQYLWVLDSDLEVAPDALRYLVAALNQNEKIGVAGCVICNTYRRQVVVESGADVNLRTGVVTARNCNLDSPSLEKFIEVDFIASGGGGSLFNVRALHDTGLHDDRYCFLWEDTDYGILLKNHGFRSVVVSDAVVYHPPFTEKRNPNIYAYYGVRNPLLTVAKYAKGLRLPWYLYCNMCRYLRIGLLMMFSGSKGFSQLTFKALHDYIFGRFGKAELIDIAPVAANDKKADLSREKRILILGLGSKEAISSVLCHAKATSRAEIMLVVQCYRQELLSDIHVDTVITYDDRASNVILEYLKTGLVILGHGGCLINTDLKVTSPLNYFSRRTSNWDNVTKRLFVSSDNIFAIWKPVAAVVIGNLLSLFLLPFVWIASLRHRMKPPVLL